MNALVAAVVSAAVSAAVSFFLQSRGYKLALEQDRLNQRRQRLIDVILEAGYVLDARGRAERLDGEDFELWKASLRADSLAAQNPEQSYDLRSFNDAASRAIWTLELHLGKGHWLIAKYLDAVVQCRAAEEAKSKHFRSTDADWRMENIRALDKITSEAGEACKEWMELAVDEIEGIRPHHAQRLKLPFRSG